MPFPIVLSLVAVSVVAIAALACGASGPPKVHVDCPDCPVLVMGQHDSDAWRFIDNADPSTYKTVQRTVLVGCAYGVNESTGSPTYVFSATPDFDQVGRESHIAFVWVLDDKVGPLQLGECYETHAAHIERDTWRDLSDLPAHLFDAMETRLLTDREWRQWRASSVGHSR